jgi:hypothetical protein
MAALINKHAIIGLGLILTMAFTLQAQDSAGEDVVQMEAFNVTAYHGKIAIIDGFTGKEYRGENDVVFNFAQSLNKLLLGYHKKLVIDEVKHLEFRINSVRSLNGKWGRSRPRSDSANSLSIIPFG